MWINRTWTLTEDVDFKTNVAPYLDKDAWATPCYAYDGTMMGWYIRQRYE